jgi:hypothetical protein
MRALNRWTLPLMPLDSCTHDRLSRWADRLLLLGRSGKRAVRPACSPLIFADSFSGPFAVWRLGRRCAAEGYRKGMTFGPASRIDV